MKTRDREAFLAELHADFELPEEIRTPKQFIEVCLDDLFFLCSVVLRHGKKVEYRDLNHIHLQLCDFLTRDPNPQKLVEMSRDSLKSTIGRGGIIQKFLKHSYADDEALMGIITGDEKLSTEHIEKIELEVLTNELIQAFFSGSVPTKASDADSWNSEMIRWRRVGIDTGSLKKTLSGKHYLLIWSDNIMNEVNSATQDLRRSAVGRWRAQEPLLIDDGEEWVTETPWEADDVSGMILDPDGRFDYTKLHRKSPLVFVSDTGFSVFSCFARNENGELNFPEKLSEKYLTRKRRKMGSSLYARQYEGQVVTSEEEVFTRKMIQWFDDLPKFFSRNIVVDCSGTTGPYSTPTAITIMEWDPEGFGYIDHAWDGKVDVMTLKKIVTDLYDDSVKAGRPVDQVGVEWEKYGIYLVQEVQASRPDIPLTPLRLLGRTRDSRILPLQGLYESGKIRSRRDLKKYEEQLLAYRRGVKRQETGILDTLAHQLDIRIIPKRFEQPTPEQIYEDDFAKQILHDRRYSPFPVSVGEQIRGQF